VLQKTLVRVVGDGPIKPDAIVEFELAVSMAQDYTFDDIVLTDVIPDGIFARTVFVTQ
jgi:hypothetical protein